MKKLISLLIAAAIIAFAVFAIMYWVAGTGFEESRTTAVVAGFTGFIVEYLKPSITKWSKQLDVATNQKTTKGRKG